MGYNLYYGSRIWNYILGVREKKLIKPRKLKQIIKKNQIIKIPIKSIRIFKKISGSIHFSFYFKKTVNQTEPKKINQSCYI